jgi:metal-dependent hydrolase (beta-lactamase superfamily II)
VNNFLIVGTKSAILFDTGLGVANIRKVAEEITPLPLLVVNSHYHFDHTGGNRLSMRSRSTESGRHSSRHRHLQDSPRDIWRTRNAC